MSFQGPNDPGKPIPQASNPGISDPRDMANLRPGHGNAPPGEVKRDRLMDWKPNLVLDATEWIQRAAMGDQKAIQEVVLVVAPKLLAEVRRLQLVSGEANLDD